jgi:predicted nucleic acid-binding protein
MILLDTNVVSEPLRPATDAHVIEWIDAQQPETLFLSAITVAELCVQRDLLSPTQTATSRPSLPPTAHEMSVHSRLLAELD